MPVRLPSLQAPGQNNQGPAEAAGASTGECFFCVRYQWVPVGIWREGWEKPMFLAGLCLQL